MGAWVDAIATAQASANPVMLALVVEGPPFGKHLVVGPDGAVLAGALGDPDLEAAVRREAADRLSAPVPGAGEDPHTLRINGLRVYLEPFLPPPDLLVVGAGHVGQAVAGLGKQLGFRVTVVDDRPAWANRERFPTADTVVCDDFVYALRRLEPGARDYVVLVTRGHQHDADCLRELLARPVAYLGMIGSRTRIGHIFAALTAEGVPAARLERVHTPIGLDIGARTPTEIGVAVVAELVMARRGGSGLPLAHLRRDRVHGATPKGGPT